jgi:hypothetical protein
MCSKNLSSRQLVDVVVSQESIDATLARDILKGKVVISDPGGVILLQPGAGKHTDEGKTALLMFAARIAYSMCLRDMPALTSQELANHIGTDRARARQLMRGFERLQMAERTPEGYAMPISSMSRVGTYLRSVPALHQSRD